MNDLLTPLFASSWDKATGATVVNQNIYDSANGTWVAEGGQPSEQEAYRRLSEILSIGITLLGCRMGE